MTNKEKSKMDLKDDGRTVFLRRGISFATVSGPLDELVYLSFGRSDSFFSFLDQVPDGLCLKSNPLVLGQTRRKVIFLDLA